ncbi:MAG: hypothetical protein AAFN17_02370 [Pseudomonadota bacterium]
MEAFLAKWPMLEGSATSLDRHYRGVSPQLLARVRQNWSVLGIDLDLLWRRSIQHMPGATPLVEELSVPDSRPIDLLLLFDQAAIWVDALRDVSSAMRARGQEARLSAAQTMALGAVTTRLMSELAAVRMMSLAGLSLPAMQVVRSLSEDVDLALLLLVRRRHAQSFVDARSPEEAAAFWRRHVAGGRAFRLVAQALYRFGLDHGDDSDYARWRKEVLVFLGTAVHGSFASVAGSTDAPGRLDSASQECLYFATTRLQEFCAYALVLGADLRADLAAFEPASPLEAERRALLTRGGDIIVDQMRWMTEDRAAVPGHEPSREPRRDALH